MLVLRVCLWVSYACACVTNVPVGEFQVCLCDDGACGRVTSALVLPMCLWVSYEGACVTNVPVGELRVCLCYECACG